MNKLASNVNRTVLVIGTRSLSNAAFKPDDYSGISYEQSLNVRGSNMSKGNIAHYKEPIMIHQGHRQFLWDIKGKKYLDLFAGIVTVSVGHCHPKVNEALRRQSQKLWHTTMIYMYPAVYEYTQKLLNKMPGKLKAVFFTNSGSESNDMAMYMARLHTGRFDIMSLRNAYHGASPYTMGLTSINTWKYPVPTNFGVTQTQNPDVYRGTWGGKNCRDSPIQANRDCDCGPNECKAGERYFEQAEDVINHSMPKGGKIAAFFAESIQGVGGTVQYPKNFLKKFVNLVQSNGGLYVADEVQTGFGRTGSHFWGFENHGVMPDIVTMAKGIGNGFPMGAVITTKEIADSMAQASHFNTFGGNPLASAVGSAVLDVIEEEKLQENCEIVGTYFLHELAKLRDEFEIVGDVRGKGLMIGIELVEDKKSKKPLAAEKMNAIWEQCKNNGVLIGKGGLSGNVFRIKPPMCITKEDVNFGMQVLREAIHANTKQ